MRQDAFDLSNLPSPRSAARRVYPRRATREDVGAVGVLRALASEIVTRSSLAAAAGLTFGGKRDLYNVLGYTRAITNLQRRERYNRGDVAARVVEAYPKATWQGGAELVEDEDPEVLTAFEEDWSALARRLQLYTVLERADILAGLGAFSIVVIGAKGPTEQELPRMARPEDVLYLQAYGPEEASIEKWDDDPQSERYGLPTEYQVRRVNRSMQGVRAQRVSSFRVHWSRAIHVADRLLDDRVNGSPLLDLVWNRLDDLEKIVGGGSEAFWLRVNQGTQFDVQPEMKMDQPAIDKLKAEAEEFAHQMRRSIATRGVKMEVKGSDVSPFNNQVSAVISLISGATGIPQRILLGSERGELASTQDRENWNERVVERRGKVGEPLVRQVADRMVEYGAVSPPVDDEYEVRWPEIAGLTAQEQADVAVKWAGLSSAAGGPVVTPEEIRDRVLKLDPLDEEQLEQAKAETRAAADREYERDDQGQFASTAGGGSVLNVKVGTKDPATLTPAQVNKELDSLREKQSVITTAMIEAGRGSELPSETLKKSDSLSEVFKQVFSRKLDLLEEIKARMGPGYYRMSPGFKRRK